MKPIFSTTIIARATLWAFIFMTEALIEFAMRKWSANIGHFSIYIPSAIAVLLMTFFLGNSKLVVDFRDLCFYDVIVHCAGWWIYVNNYNHQIFYALAVTIFILKFARVLWPIKTPNGDALADWPVFGPFSYWHSRQQSTNSNPLSFSRQDYLVYAMLLASFPVIYLLRELGMKMHLAYWAILGIAIILFKFKPFIHNLEQREIKNIEDEKRAAAQKATEAKNIELAQANAAILALLEERERDKALLQKFNESMMGAAHDLQHPVLVVRDYAERLEVATLAQREATQQALYESIDQMVELIDETIQSAQIVTGLKPVKWVAVDVRDLAMDFQRYWHDAPNQRGLERFDIYPARARPALYCATDNLILKRILRNLLSNAIMHSPAGGKLLLSSRKVGTQALLQVWDTGAGITEGQGPDGAANFVAFIARVQEARSKVVSSGYGLGMNNVLQMCRALGITMQLHAKAGRGSVFSFHLPLASSEMMAQTQHILVQEKADLDEIRAYLAARTDMPTAQIR